MLLLMPKPIPFIKEGSLVTLDIKLSWPWLLRPDRNFQVLVRDLDPEVSFLAVLVEKWMALVYVVVLSSTRAIYFP